MIPAGPRSVDSTLTWSSLRIVIANDSNGLRPG